MDRRTFKEAFLLTLPVMAGYIVLGIGFGVLLQSKGYNFAWAILMSLTIYAGSMQYLAVDLLSTGASLLSVALMTLMVNARHLFYSISMLKKYAKTGKKKPLLIFELTDETFSIICSAKPPPDIDKNWFYFFISFLNQIYWIVGSAAGSIFASLIDFDSSGIEFSMTALFVVTFLEQWLRGDNRLSAIIGVAVSLVCLLIWGKEHFIIPSMLLIALFLLFFRKKIDLNAEEDG